MTSYDFEERLAPLRESRGYTQQYVADYLGISVDVYRNYEHCKSRFPAGLMMKFSKCLNYSLTYIYNYFEQTEEEYKQNYDISLGLAAYIKRDANNRQYVLWLANEFDGYFDGVVMLAVAYATMPAHVRKHLSASIWYAFEGCFHHYPMPDIAHTLKDNAEKYEELWHNLNEIGD